VLRSRQARRRQDWLHKTTTDLAKSHGVVVIDRGPAHPEPDALSPRHNRAPRQQRASQGRAQPLDPQYGLGHGRAHAGLQMPHPGRVLVKVDPRGSSTECPRCGRCSPISRLNQATFRCVACRHAANADTNAAQVLLERGLTALSGATPGCGGTAREARLPVPHREPLPAMPAGQGHPDGPGASSCRS
jgi:putative transposase